jgi:hypothetical protein
MSARETLSGEEASMLNALHSPKDRQSDAKFSASSGSALQRSPSPSLSPWTGTSLDRFETYLV